MIKIRAVLKDLLLVGVAALAAVAFVRFTDSDLATATDPSSAEITGEIDALTPADAVSEQLYALRLEMLQAHAELNNRMSRLVPAQEALPEEEQDTAAAVQSLKDKLEAQPTFADRAAALAGSEDYDQTASDEFQDSIDTRLARLTLDNSRVNSVECYQSKCVMEFEHNAATDESLFRDNVMFDAQGLFATKFFYTTETDENGRVYTRIIMDR